MAARCSIYGEYLRTFQVVDAAMDRAMKEGRPLLYIEFDARWC